MYQHILSHLQAFYSNKSDSTRRILAATKVLRPRSNVGINLGKTKWKPTENNVVRSTTFQDAKEFRATLIAITKADPERAARCINLFLKHESNHLVKEIVHKSFSKLCDDTNVNDLIIGGINDCINHHT